MSRVLITEATYEDCREAIDEVFELFPVSVEGKRVLVKPNVVAPAKPERARLTHPAIVKAIVNKLRSLKPACIIVGDNPGAEGYGQNEATFRGSGMLEAAGSCYQNIGARAVAVDFDPRFFSKLAVSRAVFEADVVISVPKFKTHVLPKISGAVKNSYGFLPGGQKGMGHLVAEKQRDYAELLLSVFRLRVPDLFIMDAVLGMEGDGPRSPDVRWIGKILASDDAIALDAVVARMMGFDPSEVALLSLAQSMGLGRYENAEVIGKLELIPNFKKPLPYDSRSEADFARNREFFGAILRRRPQFDLQKCRPCDVCVEGCPMDAIRLEALPIADNDKCNVCYCCQELCPTGAITLV